MVVTETQKFAPWVLWLMRGLAILLSIILVWVFAMDALASLNRVWVVLIVVISVLPMLSLEIMRLQTEYSDEGISLNFVPFAKAHYKWSEIEKADMINYGFVGGWGIRIGTQYGTVYNTQGSEGLSLTLKNGKRVVIGTQKPDAIGEVVNQYIYKTRS